MILAAGFGTRLKPLTDSIPKALVKIDGRPMIRLVLDKLIEFGIKEVVINTHHHAEQVENYIKGNDFRIKIHLIHEKKILGTGGGIKNARAYLESSKDFLVHNVDVMSGLDLGDFYKFHLAHSSLVTLALKKRDTSRPLIIDSNMSVVGRKNDSDILTFKEAAGNISDIGFCGIHIISSKIFSHFSEDGFFDIFTTYFRLIKEGFNIIGYNIGNRSWVDLCKTVQT
jgi:NDP-sugar pyrophosphorylase family protein